MKPDLPNLIVIGAMKSGTTSLHDYLDQHPGIFMSKVKEIDYFVKELHWDDGLEWYRAQFDGEIPIRGESSQNYTKRHHFEAGVVDRISDTLPDVRFVYLVRDPIERIVSHYHEALEGGYAPPEGMNAFLAKEPVKNHYVLTSSYYYQILPYVERFGIDRIHFATLEDLKTDRLDTMNRMFDFLGLPRVTDDSLFDFIRNSGTEKRKKSSFGQLMLGSHISGLRALFPREAKDWLKRSDLARKVMTTKVKREELDPKIAAVLRGGLRKDTESLRALTGQSFESWSI